MKRSPDFPFIRTGNYFNPTVYLNIFKLLSCLKMLLGDWREGGREREKPKGGGKGQERPGSHVAAVCSLPHLTDRPFSAAS